MPERIKVRRNGNSVGGKLLIKPSSWEELLKRCSVKLSSPEDATPFVASRLFTPDGFEIDELEEIFADDQVVVSAGEDFIVATAPGVSPVALSTCSSCSSNHADQRSIPTVFASVAATSGHSASSSPVPALCLSNQSLNTPPSSPLELKNIESHRTPSSLESKPPPAAAHAQVTDRQEPSVQEQLGQGPAPAPTALPSCEPAAHLTVLQSAPLTTKEESGRVRPLPQLNLASERDVLREMLARASKAVRLAFEIATTDNLRSVITLGTKILHYSGHGEETFLAFEDGVGATHAVTPQLLASTCCAGASSGARAGLGGLELVFVCACHSQPAAAAFARAGVPHVVAVRSSALLLDNAAICFTRHFYLALVSGGKSVAAAFEARQHSKVAQAAVSAMPSHLIARRCSARESAKFVLIGSGDHDDVIFAQAALAAGDLVDLTRPLCTTNLPVLSEIFVGRQMLMQSAIAALLSRRRRCVCLVGPGGIGKTSLAIAVGHYLRFRHAFVDGVFYVDARGLTSCLQLVYAISAALRLPNTVGATELQAREELLGALSSKHVCLLIDRCDSLSQTEHSAEFCELLSVMLRRGSRLQLLLTNRKFLGVPNEQPLSLTVAELRQDEAQTLLRQMASVAASHASILADLCGGMPLALRLCGCALAHTRVRVSPEQLIERLQQESHRLRELRALSELSGDTTIEASIGTSYFALPSTLRFVFLAVCEFPGSFDEQAALSLLLPVDIDGESGEWNQGIGTSSNGHADAPSPADSLAASSNSSMLNSPRSDSLRTHGNSEGDLRHLDHAQTQVAELLSQLSCTTSRFSAARGSNVPSRQTSARTSRSGASSFSEHAEHEGVRAHGDDAAILSESDVRSALQELTEHSMVEAIPSEHGGRRYRLHELIRLFGCAQIKAEGRAGSGASLAWRGRFVRHYTQWLAEQNARFGSEDLSALAAFDAERHNVEAALSLAEEVPSLVPLFPPLLVAGRLLLRQRMDHGSRRALFNRALRALEPKPHARGDGGEASENGHCAAADAADAIGGAHGAALDLSAARGSVIREGRGRENRAGNSSSPPEIDVSPEIGEDSNWTNSLIVHANEKTNSSSPGYCQKEKDTVLRSGEQPSASQPDASATVSQMPSAVDAGSANDTFTCVTAPISVLESAAASAAQAPDAATALSTTVAAAASTATAAGCDLLPLLLLELGFAMNNSCMYAEAAATFTDALQRIVGNDAAAALLVEAGLASNADTEVQCDRSKIVPASPAASEQERVLEQPPSTAFSLSGEELGVSLAADSVQSSSDELLSTPTSSNIHRPPREDTMAEEQNAQILDDVHGDIVNRENEQLGDEIDAFESLLRAAMRDVGAGETPADAFVLEAAECINLLACNLDARGLFRGSQLLHIHALRIRRHLRGAEHPDVAASYNNLANLLRKPTMSGRRNVPGGRADDRAHRRLSAKHNAQLVLALYRRALQIREERLGPDSPTVAATLSNLSVSLSLPGPDQDVDEAEKFVRRGLQIRLNTYGDGHPEVAHSLNLLANLMYYQRGNLQEAERLYQRSLDIRERYYMRHSDRVAQTLHNLASLARAQGMEDRAEALYKECLEIRRDLAGVTHPETQRTAEQLVVLYRAQGRTEQLTRMQAMISAWRRQSSTDVSAHWLREVVPFQLPAGLGRMPSDFKLNSHIIGAKGVHLKHIQKESGAAHVFLGPADKPATDAANFVSSAVDKVCAATGGAADAASNTALPAIIIEAASEQALARARELCIAHLANVQSTLSRWSRRPTHDREQRGSNVTRSRGQTTREKALKPARSVSASDAARAAPTLADFMMVKDKGRTRTK